MDPGMVVEGWIVESNLLGARELWIVSGYTHPDGYLVVSPYIIGGVRVKRYDWSLIPGWLIGYIPCIGRRAPLIPWRSIRSIINPEDVLRIRRRDIPGEILELIDIINPEWVGLTGSWAILSESPLSDIDILVYGDHISIYETLVDLREEGLIRPCRIEERYEKISDKLTRHSYLKLAGFKVLDSCYKNVPYTIRILRRLRRSSCHGMVVDMGAYEGFIKLVEPLEPQLTPAKYIIEIEGRRVYMETWHTRFMELPIGSYKGRLELFYGNEFIASPDITGYLEGPL